MAIMMLRQLVGPNWIMESGEVYELGALQEHHWIAAGYACEWTEEDQRLIDESTVNIGFDVNVNGLHIDAEQ